VLPATAPSGRWLSGNRYFFLEVLPPAHCRASAHFFSEISRLRLARDCGRGAARASVLPRELSHSTQLGFGSPAAIFAYSSAFSLPVTLLWAGHHRISMTIPGLTLRSMAMCFRAWRAHCCPGPGLSDAIRLMAACASEKRVTRSGGTLLCAVTSTRNARRWQELWRWQ